MKSREKRNGRKYCNGKDRMLKQMAQKTRLVKMIVYGCQMNFAEAERMEGQLREIGFESTEDAERADLILMHTCCVRETAEDKAYGKIGEIKRLKREKPSLLFGVTGCMAQKESEALIRRAPHIDFVLGTGRIGELSRVVEEFFAEREGNNARHVVDVAENGALPEDGTPARQGTVSAWVPIMYGCDNFCTYCIVPYVRGRERSRLPEDILREIGDAAAKGFKEITLGSGGTPLLLSGDRVLRGDGHILYRGSYELDFLTVLREYGLAFVKEKRPFRETIFRYYENAIFSLWEVRRENEDVYGYCKDPNDSKKWLIDPEAAEVVRKIFLLLFCQRFSEGEGFFAFLRENRLVALLLSLRVEDRPRPVGFAVILQLQRVAAEQNLRRADKALERAAVILHQLLIHRIRRVARHHKKHRDGMRIAAWVFAVVGQVLEDQALIQRAERRRDLA